MQSTKSQTDARKLMGIPDRQLTRDETAAILQHAFERTRIKQENELLLQSGRKMPARIVEEELGTAAVYAFEYLDQLLFSGNRSERVANAKDKRRHAYDSAYWAANFGFSEDDITVVILHDILEYTSKSLQEVHSRADDVKSRFGDYVAGNVLRVADFSAITINEISRRITKDGRKTESIVEDIKKYLGWIKNENRNGRRKHEYHYKGLEDVVGKLSQRRVSTRYNISENYSVYDELKQMAVPLFVENIFIDARERLENGNASYHVPVLARAASYIDRVRTMGNEQAMLTTKETSIFIDRLNSFNELLGRSSIVNNAMRVMEAALINQMLTQTGIIIEGYRGRDSAFLTEKKMLEGALKEMAGKYRSRAIGI